MKQKSEIEIILDFEIEFVDTKEKQQRSSNRIVLFAPSYNQRLKINEIKHYVAKAFLSSAQTQINNQEGKEIKQTSLDEIDGQQILFILRNDRDFSLKGIESIIDLLLHGCCLIDGVEKLTETLLKKMYEIDSNIEDKLCGEYIANFFMPSLKV